MQMRKMAKISKMMKKNGKMKMSQERMIVTSGRMKKMRKMKTKMVKKEMK